MQGGLIGGTVPRSKPVPHRRVSLSNGSGGRGNGNVGVINENGGSSLLEHGMT